MRNSRIFALACTLLLSAPIVLAQGSGPMPPQGRPEGGPRPERHEGRGLGVPPGTWWRNPATIQALSLDADQQKHLDDIFLQSRIQLISMRASLDEEQLKLEPLLNTNPPDQERALAQIAKIADLRAGLEKANARMLLSLRAVLKADQWTKLQTEQHARREERDTNRGPHKGDGTARRGHGSSNTPEMPPAPGDGAAE